MNHYFYIDAEGNQKGTFSPEELRREGIRRDTLVWTQGMEQWKRAEETEELRSLFSDVHGTVQETTHQPPVQQGYTAGGISGSQYQQPMPKTWLVESILVVILPFILCGSLLSLIGIIGIIYASQVESFYLRGDYIASQESSRAAAKWTKITLWIMIGWILLLVISLILFFIFIGSLSGFGGINNLLNT